MPPAPVPPPGGPGGTGVPGVPGAVALAPNAQGYVFVETKSGKTRCQINRAEVGCESQFTNPPIQHGAPANGVRVSAEGAVQWLLGNLGDIPAVTLDYRTYQAQGWTIAASSSGTRFSNDRTGHGMMVSVQDVQVF
jgi:hypothetical protein